MAEEPRRLGRGLAALIGSSQDEAEIVAPPKHGQRKAPVEFLRPNPRNPRKDFSDARPGRTQRLYPREGDTAADRRSGCGRSAPISSRSSLEKGAGGPRNAPGLHEVPIVVVVADDREALELAIIENVQRVDLNPLEEAQGYERLIAEHGYTHGEIAKAIGKSRSHVANMTRLVKLPEKTRRMLAEGHISAGHARALLAVSEPDAVATNIVERGLTVRDVERIAQQQADPEHAPTARKSKPAEATDADSRAVAKRLADALGLGVQLKSRGETGELIIRYKSLEQLDALCDKLAS